MAENVQDAATQLQQIFAKITDGSTDDDRLAVRQELITFMADIPADPEYRQVRSAAKDAFDDLGNKVTAGALARMRDRSHALAESVEVVTAVANKTANDANLLQLKTVKAVVDGTVQAITAVNAIKTAIKSNDLATAATNVDTVFNLLLQLQQQVGGTAPATP
jgi:hypothetical protein